MGEKNYSRLFCMTSRQFNFKMAGFRDADKQHFPLQNIQDVVDLFRDHLEKCAQPNLSLLSIVLGAIENTLTVNRAIPQDIDTSKNLEPIFPVIELSTVEALQCKFVSHVKGSVDLSQYTSGYATRDLVKRVSDVIWGSLTRTYYKDRAHLQSLYSFLTGKLYRHFEHTWCVLSLPCVF